VYWLLQITRCLKLLLITYMYVICDVHAHTVANNDMIHTYWLTLYFQFDHHNIYCSYYKYNLMYYNHIVVTFHCDTAAMYLVVGVLLLFLFLLSFGWYTLYVYRLKSQYAHIPSPKGAW
jgi:hypothetical protein